MKVVLATQSGPDFYVGCSPKIKISTQTDDLFADLIVGANGAFWRSAHERHYRFSSWESLSQHFETDGLLGAPSE